MGKFIRHNNNIPSSKLNNSVKMVSASQHMKSEVLSRVTIPMYFYNIIVPQLGNYYDVYPVDFENKPVVCCPLHDEDTPSCRYYPDTESFYCFGCAKGGNVIYLHKYFASRMNGTEVSLDESIAFLYNYFVKGKETETFVKEQTVTKEKLNSDYDIVKFNLYRVNLEQSITVDNNLDDNIKRELWKDLDNIDCLLSLDMIKADEAESYLKKRVRELIK